HPTAKPRQGDRDSASRRASPALRTPRRLTAFDDCAISDAGACVASRAIAGKIHIANTNYPDSPARSGIQLVRFIAPYSPQPRISQEMEFCAATAKLTFRALAQSHHAHRRDSPDDGLSASLQG